MATTDKKMTTTDIRRQNLRRWLETHPAPSREKSYFSQLATGVASFGEKAARRLESEYKMGDGYLDRPIKSDSEEDAPQRHYKIASNRAENFAVEIPHYREVVGSMGKDIILQDQPGQIVSLIATEEWMLKNVPSNTGPANLCVVTGFGDSMKGMFNRGDPILVDTGVKSCQHDGVYFFRVGNEGFIKRLQRVPGVGIRVIPQNKDYETWTITPDMDFHVLGKVLKVWESRDF